MAQKSFMYAMLEAVQHEMRADKNMVWIFELTPPVSSNPGKPVINGEVGWPSNGRTSGGAERAICSRLGRPRLVKRCTGQSRSLASPASDASGFGLATRAYASPL